MKKNIKKNIKNIYIYDIWNMHRKHSLKKMKLNVYKKERRRKG